jgi:rifampicin phosphotransferase
MRAFDVMTSEGEIISGESLGGKIPGDALPGIPVSAGIIEGRARHFEDGGRSD